MFKWKTGDSTYEGDNLQNKKMKFISKLHHQSKFMSFRHKSKNDVIFKQNHYIANLG